LWGTGTSAFQIEGSPSVAQKGPSIWDTFSKASGQIEDDSNADVACDSYRKSERDISLLSELGIQAYRFSFSWPRIQPEGRGIGISTALDHYDRFIDTLLKRDIQPWVTLYHWDLPQALEDRGGWPCRDTAFAFADYAEIVAERFGDRVCGWVTQNEPWCASTLGYREGVHAPGRKNPADAIMASHHLLLGHGLALQILRKHAPKAQVGLALNLSRVDAATDDEADIKEAQLFDGELNRWYCDAIFHSEYPQDVLERYERSGALPRGHRFIQPGDEEVIGGRIDYLGLNYYLRALSSAKGTQSAVTPDSRTEIQRTDMGWEVYPRGLLNTLQMIHDRWAPPSILITENGAAFPDRPDETGAVFDFERTDYLYRHLNEVKNARDAGIPVHGYFAWSLLDNFEWDRGLSKRFGLVYCDFASGQCTPKESARWYAKLIQSGTLEAPVRSGQ
jgi:beta-glucosidase